MGQAVKCPDCRTEVELPGVIKPGKKYLCPDCNTRLPVGDAAPPPKPRRKVELVEDEEPTPPKRRPRRDEDDAPPPRRSKRRDDDEDDDRPRKRRKGGAKAVAKPFWKSRMGKILSGVGLLVIGGGLIALVLLTDVTKPLKGILLGGLCILLGLGSIGAGAVSSDEDDDTDDESDDDDSGGGGDWGDD